MNLVIVAQVKNLKSVVVHYNANPKNNIKDIIVIARIKIFFLELNIS